MEKADRAKGRRMPPQLKRLIKGRLSSIRQKKYFRRMEEKSLPYDDWIREKEVRAALFAQTREAWLSARFSARRVSYPACADYVNGNGISSEEVTYVIFTAEGGEEAPFAEALFSEYFRTHPDTDLCYGDEDIISPEGLRYLPWLKPDWSPDTFLTCFYFGSVFAVRVSALRELTRLEREDARLRPGEDVRAGLYRMCCHIASKSGGFMKREGKEKDFPVGHVDEILYHSHKNPEKDLLYAKEFPGEEAGKTLVSVIIPSMDHPVLLRRCIESVKRNTALPLEIIVVDNGSGEETREELEAYLGEQGAIYLYRRMPFDFSKMCNAGAARAGGDVYLFLNDDAEVPAHMQRDWLAALAGQARRPYAGAVGMKLLYPDSERIQHAGIVNTRLGPVHKLQFKEDAYPCGGGWNRGRRNVIAVTGACLAVSAEKFAEISGFPEELPVAFNDVDLCFSLHEKGYYNVVLQDFFLYHHESLSRGQDEGEEKLERLIGERKKLYERHGEMYAKDPFYHKYFAGDILTSGFETGEACEWQEGTAARRAEEADNGCLKKARQDDCVAVSLEYAGTVGEWTGNRHTDSDYYIQGYCFVSGSDNACYDKEILLWGEDGTYTVQPAERVRTDVEANLPDQVNVGLSGFQAVIDRKSLPSGSYRIGILARDRCFGQDLYRMTDRYLRCGKSGNRTGGKTLSE